ncbi:hypothetical protein V8G54_030118, partial [Vigna mungo]
HYKKCIVYRRNITEGFLAVGINHIPKAFARRYKHSLNLGFPYSILPKSLRKQGFPFLSSLSPLPSPPPLSYFVPQRTSVSQSSITVLPSPLIMLDLLSIVQKRVWLKDRGIDVMPSVVDGASLRICWCRSFGSVSR